MSQPLISLCMIAGNEAMHVRRCLSTFKPCAAEIVVVRAVGSLAPDETLDIAANEFGAITAEYKNAPENADWPHVDNFANARNMAFDLATGKFILWVDFDDIAEPAHVLGILEAAEDADLKGWDILHFGYYIPYAGAKPLRERLIRRGCARWQNAVHECITEIKAGTRMAYNEQLQITHAPLINKVKTGDSSRRNLRILETIKDKTHGEAFFYFMELIGAGRKVEAVEAAKVALANENLAPPERYEIFLNLSSASDDTKMRRGFLHEAYKISPERREALTLLCVEATNWREPETALAYARSFKALPRPMVRNFTHRDNAYAFGGDLIYAGALRLNGKFDEADDVEIQNFMEAGNKISLIHATRGRAMPAAMARKYWFDTAADPTSIEHIFALDSDDTETLGKLQTFRHVVAPAGGGCVAAWNAAAAASRGRVLIQMSDDWIPPIGWDKMILERLGDLSKPAVLAISDGHRKDGLLCMAILTRARYLQQRERITGPGGGKSWTPAFMFHPDFKSMYSDNYFSWSAYRDGVVIDGRDIVIEHKHPVFDASIPVDKTYADSNTPERYEQGKAVFERLTGDKLP